MSSQQASIFNASKELDEEILVVLGSIITPPSAVELLVSISCLPTYPLDLDSKASSLHLSTDFPDRHTAGRYILCLSDDQCTIYSQIRGSDSVSAIVESPEQIPSSQ